MEITVKINLDDPADAKAAFENKRRIGFAIANLRIMQQTWQTVAERMDAPNKGKGNGRHNRAG